jgi:hypothetical protein
MSLPLSLLQCQENGQNSVLKTERIGMGQASQLARPESSIEGDGLGGGDDCGLSSCYISDGQTKFNGSPYSAVVGADGHRYFNISTTPGIM